VFLSELTNRKDLGRCELLFRNSNIDVLTDIPFTDMIRARMRYVPTPQTVPYIGAAAFTVTAGTGSRLVSVTGCGGSLSGSTYTSGQIEADCTVTATFETDAAISVSPPRKGFGNVTGGTSSTQAFTLSSAGTAALTVNSTSLSGGDKTMFSLTQGTCPSLTPTIAAGQSCAIDVTFAPDTAGTKTTILVITSNAYNAPALNLGLGGTGVCPLTVTGAAAGSAGTVTGGTAINCTIAADGTASGVCLETDSVSTVVLTASPAPGASTIWSGCTVTLTPTTTVTAAFSSFTVKTVQGDATVALYSTIQAAFDIADSEDIVEMQASTFGENPSFNLNNVQITLGDGFDAPFTSQTGYSTIAGTLTISAGTVTVEDLMIR
jgi:hypothetical protein